MCTTAGRREGHFLKMVYGIWSTGLGADEDFSREMTLPISSLVKGVVHMGMEGDGHEGIHSGWLNVLGVAEYTLDKYPSAHCLLKEGLVAVALSSSRT